MMPKRTAKEAFLRKAYLYTKENGPMTIHELPEAVRINPNTKRVSAQIPTIRAACQYLTSSKKFNVSLDTSATIRGGQYTINRYLAVGESYED